MPPAQKRYPLVEMNEDLKQKVSALHDASVLVAPPRYEKQLKKYLSGVHSAEEAMKATDDMIGEAEEATMLEQRKDEENEANRKTKKNKKQKAAASATAKSAPKSGKGKGRGKGRGSAKASGSKAARKRSVPEKTVGDCHEAGSRTPPAEPASPIAEPASPIAEPASPIAEASKVSSNASDVSQPVAKAPKPRETRAKRSPAACHDADVSFPKDGVEPPSHVNSNKVYSNAYRKEMKASSNKDKAREIGRLASAQLAVHGVVSKSLVGSFRSKPRAKQAKPTDVVPAFT